MCEDINEEIISNINCMYANYMWNNNMYINNNVVMYYYVFVCVNDLLLYCVCVYMAYVLINIIIIIIIIVCIVCIIVVIVLVLLWEW